MDPARPLAAPSLAARSLAALGLVLAAAPARADGILVAGDYPKVHVEVGKTVEQDVVYRRGRWFCDDPSLLTADLVTHGDHNFWVVTGVKPGSTQCRVGTTREGYSVFDVYVTAAAAPAPKVSPKPPPPTAPKAAPKASPEAAPGASPEAST